MLIWTQTQRLCALGSVSIAAFVPMATDFVTSFDSTRFAQRLITVKIGRNPWPKSWWEHVFLGTWLHLEKAEAVKVCATYEIFSGLYLDFWNIGFCWAPPPHPYRFINTRLPRATKKNWTSRPVANFINGGYHSCRVIYPYDRWHEISWTQLPIDARRPWMFRKSGFWNFWGSYTETTTQGLAPLS